MPIPADLPVGVVNPTCISVLVMAPGVSRRFQASLGARALATGRKWATGRLTLLGAAVHQPRLDMGHAVRVW